MTEQPKEYRIEGREPTIFRVVKDPNNPYVMVDRRPIDNPELSFRAKGILAYLLSRPDGWEVNLTDLENHGKEGRDAIRAGLTELRDAGHLEYQQEREAGKFGTGKILVHEAPKPKQPQTEKPYTVSVPHPEKPHAEKPRTVNPTQVLSTLSNTEFNQTTTTTPAPARTEPTTPTQARPNTYALYESNVGPLTPLVSDELRDLEAIYSPAWVERAIAEAVRSGVRNLKYIGAVLQGYKKRGSPDIGRDFVNKGTAQAVPASRAPANNSLDAIRRVAQRTAGNAR